jgi:hypothetical protein
MPLIHFLDGSRPPLELKSGDVVIGSGERCAVRLADPAISPEHARISSAGDVVTIQDLDSFSGTMKNGDFVYGKQPLADGDVIQVGPFKLKYGRAAYPAAFDSDDGVKTPPLGMTALSDDDEKDGRTVQMDAAEIEALMKAAPPPKTASMAVVASDSGPAPLPPPPAAPPGDSAPLSIDAPKEAPKQRSAAAYNATMPPVAKDELDKIKAQAAARRTVMGIAPPPLAPVKPAAVVIKTPPKPQPVVEKPPESVAMAKTMAMEAPKLPPAVVERPPTAEPPTLEVPTSPRAPDTGSVTMPTLDRAPIELPTEESPTKERVRKDATAKTTTYVAGTGAPPTGETTGPLAVVRRSLWQRIVAFFKRLFGK